MRQETINNIHNIAQINKSTIINGTNRNRSIGVMRAFDVKSNADANRITSELFKQGIFVRPLGKTLYILPPYCITSEELNNFYITIQKLI